MSSVSPPIKVELNILKYSVSGTGFFANGGPEKQEKKLDHYLSHSVYTFTVYDLNKFHCSRFLHYSSNSRVTCFISNFKHGPNKWREMQEGCAKAKKQKIEIPPFYK